VVLTINYTSYLKINVQLFYIKLKLSTNKVLNKIHGGIIKTLSFKGFCLNFQY